MVMVVVVVVVGKEGCSGKELMEEIQLTSTSMAHNPTPRRRPPRNHPHNRLLLLPPPLLIPRLQEIRRLHLRLPPNLPQQHHPFRPLIPQQRLQPLPQTSPRQHVPPDTDTQTLPEPFPRRRSHRFVGQGAGFRHDAHAAGVVLQVGHYADAAFGRRGDDAGAVWADEAGARLRA